MTEIIERTPTPEEIVNARRVVGGPRDLYRGVYPLKYDWTKDLFQRMRFNDWNPNTVNLVQDKYDFEQLTDGEKLCFKRALAFLSNLDAIQLNNLVENISGYITSPEIKRCLNRQVWEEEIHVESYSQIVESVCGDRDEIYNMYLRSALLRDKNEFIITQGANIHQDEGYTHEKFALALDANACLEGIYFFSGFLSIFAIGRGTRKMLGSMDMIKYILRDELTHLDLFAMTRNEFAKENPGVYTPELMEKRIQMFKTACDLETRWGEFVIEKGVLGLTPQIVRGFLENITDKRAAMMGIPTIYGTKNPVPWFDEFASLDSGKGNYFERRVKEYSTGALEWDE